MSISYANVAAQPQAPRSELDEELVSASASVPGSPKLTANESSSTEPASTTLNADSTSAEVAGDASSEQVSSASAPAPAPKAKKVLTPAPVPSKAVWGSTASVPLSQVDEHKWPTPDQVSAIKQSQESTTKASLPKDIKANKWVPISAKVVLPSPRSSQSNGAGNQLKNKRKNKTTRKVKPASAPPSGYEGSDKNDEVAPKDEEGNESDEKSTSTTEAEQHQDVVDSDTHTQHQSQTDNRQRFNQQQKNFRRYNQSGAPQGTVNGRPHGQQLQRQQGGYYQQFVPSQYQGNNRQFRSGNGGNVMYGRNNSNGNIHAGGHFAVPNGFRPMGNGPFVPLPQHPQPMMAPGIPFGLPPVQIPPPISPKQDPEQALTQQIDYYFSLENLIRDVYLRRNMGTEGWVELDLILNFKRVKIIVNGIKNAIEESSEEIKEEKLDKAILTAVQQCQNLEIGYLNGKDDNDAKATEVQLRVKHDFEQWILPDN
ncbi:la-related protein 1 [Metschnikowia aff. pulcherrima]|uniref:La-related protein 1 n=1 Tax=Metschnikowia aff. pulcherrima TaxID=2163413 RepID=A0A4P6XIU5_9ASCO|nr:la-related protein 1 [Metschnikowia aff. pulcherrima]